MDFRLKNGHLLLQLEVPYEPDAHWTGDARNCAEQVVACKIEGATTAGSRVHGFATVDGGQHELYLINKCENTSSPHHHLDLIFMDVVGGESSVAKVSSR